MPLLQLWLSVPETILAMSLEQVVSMSGNGKLSDKSESSHELRQYFSELQTDKLEEYINHCLNYPFNQSGYVLQDLINELGRRLEYNVNNGLYVGTKNNIGHDGLWESPEGNKIIIEVKTTDAYRINLDTLAKYKIKLTDKEDSYNKWTILIVVGRQDTGDFEAQIRGSRHAWDIRIISVEALLKLAKLKESSEDELTLKKIRSLLIPFEYTRLDNIIDVMFTTATDKETTEYKDIPELLSQPAETSTTVKKQNKTPSEVLSSIRSKIILSYNKKFKVNMIAKSKALYWTQDGKTRAVCTISKHYEKSSDYWYALHDNWLKFLADGSVGYYLLGFTDNDSALVLPLEFMQSMLGQLNKTTQKDRTYWHILVQKDQDGNMKLLRAGSLPPIDVDKYRISVL